MNVMGCFTDLSEIRVFMSCGFKFCLTDRISRIRQHFARTTVCRWKMEIYLICVPAGVTQSGSSQVYPCPPLKRLGHCGWEESMVVS